ncbi:XdhC family protein [Pseudodesulfovibrio sp.]|uniref:XdhC family protein n=1 Tax=unclassified Pseudodesulfovibrio TaxID=2661612 RepID=UPI003B009520
MKSLIRSLCGLLEDGESFVLATVVESSGSTPRSSGAKMAVRADGSILGTVGGGLVEAEACRDARALLDGEEEDGVARLSFVDMTSELAANSDMICGGGLTVLLEVVEPGGPCALALSKVDSLMRRGVHSALNTRIQGNGDDMRAVNHVITTGPQESRTPSFLRDEEGMRLAEPMIPPAPLFIFGAGHVSLFTAKVGAMVGFRTVVLDDRDDFANRDRFPEADDVVVLENFKDCFAGQDVGEDAFIVIVTRGHLHDRTVLAQALRTPAGYVGMIGSKSKRDKIYESLLADGYTQADIDRCHCPIGLTIGAQTPEEIAVSIAAELIQERSGGK